jgi:hypothetical protein
MAPPAISVPIGTSKHSILEGQNKIVKKSDANHDEYYDNHQGSKGSKNHQDYVTPLPKDQMFVAFTVQLTEALNITTLFPYVAFMVEDFGPPYSGKDLGTYVGIVAACFCGT